MSLSLDENQAKYQVRAYKPGFIQINEIVYTKSIIVSPNELITDWTPQNLSSLSSHDLKIILTLKPELLLIGTGENLIFPPIEIYGDLINAGIGVEIMNTSAASRTYNALASENRKVVAALLIN